MGTTSRFRRHPRPSFPGQLTFHLMELLSLLMALLAGRPLGPLHFPQRAFGESELSTRSRDAGPAHPHCRATESQLRRRVKRRSRRKHYPAWTGFASTKLNVNCRYIGLPSNSMKHLRSGTVSTTSKRSWPFAWLGRRTPTAAPWPCVFHRVAPWQPCANSSLARPTVAGSFHKAGVSKAARQTNERTCIRT